MSLMLKAGVQRLVHNHRSGAHVVAIFRFAYCRLVRLSIQAHKVPTCQTALAPVNIHVIERVVIRGHV